MGKIPAPKKSLPLGQVYRILEPGPVILLTTSHRGRANVMAQSWHTMLEFEPPLVGMVVSDRNFSFKALLATRECVINVPTSRLSRAVVGCGNTSGARIDKFAKFDLTPEAGKRVGAPLIREFYANLEARVVDSSAVRKYGFFVLEVVQGWIDPAAKDPKTLHHRGMGRFMIAGRTVRLPSRMK